MTPPLPNRVSGLDGQPEGSGGTPTRVPRWVLPVAVVFAVYLLFRIAQGFFWLSHHL